jgi:hypothetical protein
VVVRILAKAGQKNLGRGDKSALVTIDYYGKVNNKEWGKGDGQASGYSTLGGFKTSP